MFADEHAPLALLVELTPKLAKKRYRQSIYEAWDHKCVYCEAPATSLDHVVPKFKSGSSNRNNLVPSCKRCNANKASNDLETWYLEQDFFEENRYNKIKAWIKQNPLEPWDSFFLLPSVS